MAIGSLRNIASPLTAIINKRILKMKTNSTIIFRIFIFLFCFIEAGTTCYANDIDRDTLKVLFVGNSYTYMNNLPQITSIITNNCKTKLITQKSCSGGATIKDHWQGNRGLRTKELISVGNYDIVVIQGQSREPINEKDSLLKYSALICDLIKEKGGKPYLFATWSREKVPQHQEVINDVYRTIALNTGAKLVPVGSSWKLAKKLRPEIELYSFDGSHPSELGTFLTACVFVSGILNELPEKLASPYSIKDMYGESVLLMYIDPLDVIFIKEIVKSHSIHK